MKNNYGPIGYKPNPVVQLLNGLFLLFLVATMLIPIWNTLVISLSSNASSMEVGLKMWPSEFSFEGYQTVWKTVRLWEPFLNNTIVTVVGTTLHVVLSAMAGYVLIQRGLPGRNLMISLIMLTMTIPGEAIMIPVYQVVKELDLLNTLTSLVVSGLVSGFSVLLIRNYFLSIPYELNESARIDGAGNMWIFVRMYLPLAKAGLATIALFEFVGKWNQFTPALLYITDQSKLTLQIALRSLVVESDATSSNFFMTPNVRMAGVMIAIIPLIVIYPFVQKFFVKGIMLGSTKE
ncbi:carbohydrate ABC transporter permease [Paenibacillus spongiae]|uniref:Carbohydrate ABC transporter permease n=1 Tax=Paenibacillus spongiae TaxID=2909671 RepID=A0ABY5SBW6_9BACL|nr:carbohydrate ABC transporter permease [Paenibacillus spongiae]UVI31264.1 carbohydrate ABC transporter permease [Paenibacillus spongiae]